MTLSLSLSPGMLCAMLVILMIAPIILMIIGPSKWTMIALGSAGALVFSLYIVYDTQVQCARGQIILDWTLIIWLSSANFNAPRESAHMCFF